jgi:hypothetical protein
VIDKDATRLMHTLVNDMVCFCFSNTRWIIILFKEGDSLCHMFGICPKKMSLLDNLAVNDVRFRFELEFQSIVIYRLG